MQPTKFFPHYVEDIVRTVKADPEAMGAMEASFAIILSNIWLKQYRTALSRDVPEMFMVEKDFYGRCPECKKKVTYRSQGVECEACLNWYHVKCDDISEDEYRKLSEIV